MLIDWPINIENCKFRAANILNKQKEHWIPQYQRQPPDWTEGNPNEAQFRETVASQIDFRSKKTKLRFAIRMRIF